MEYIQDNNKRNIRLTEERVKHIKENHPEMSGQFPKIRQTIQSPDQIMYSITDSEVELFYKDYPKTPVTHKYLCVVVKDTEGDCFMITAYFTDTIKKGKLVWKKE